MGEQKTCYATSLRKYFAAKTKVCSGLLSTEARYKMTREMTLCFFSSMYRFHPELENSHTHKHMYNVHEHKHAESCKQIRGIRRNTNMNLMHKSWDVENERLKRSKIFLSLSPFFFFFLYFTLRALKEKLEQVSKHMSTAQFSTWLHKMCVLCFGLASFTSF